KDERLEGAFGAPAESVQHGRDRVAVQYLQAQQMVEETPGHANLLEAGARISAYGADPSLDRFRRDRLGREDALCLQDTIQVSQETLVRLVVLSRCLVQFEVTFCVECDRAGRGGFGSQERQRRKWIGRLKRPDQDRPSPVSISSLEHSHQFGLQQSARYQPPHISTHRDKATARARRGASSGFSDQPSEKPLLAQDQLTVGNPVIASAEIGQKAPHGGSVKTKAGPLPSPKRAEVSIQELFGLAPVNAESSIIHSTSSPSPRATSRNWSRAIFV